MNPPELPPNTVFSVTQLTGLLKDIIESSFPSIQLEGEISNWKPAPSGHVYFTLKDAGAQISAVMWRGSTTQLTFRPKDGMLVRCTGKLTIYPLRGNYQIIVSSMEIAGAGNILQMLEERKQRLADEGLFEDERKRPIPAYPHTIGVVTSPTGAALRDILQITRRRNSRVSVTIFPALVQGDGAAETIVRQIQIANAYKMCDVLIVGRGGGSLEDLLPFSDERVVRAIAASEIPIISAVGHEIDWALSDYAADRRAPTPSAAAELAVPLEADLRNALHTYADDLYRSITQKTQNMRLMVQQFKPENLEMKFRSIEQPLTQRFDTAKEALFTNVLQRLKDTKQHINICIQVLENASPQTILSRGYSMVRIKATDKVLRSAAEIKEGGELEIVPAQGKITATVTHTDTTGALL